MKTPTPKNQFSFTKEELITAYKNHLPAKWIKFAFKYFSKETEKKDMKPSNTIVGILLSLFLVGFVATVAKLPRPIIKWATIAYSIILAILVGFLFAAVFANNRRIKKIVKELGCTIQEYNKAADSITDDELK